MFYSDEIIEEVREKNDIVNIVGSYVTLKKNGSSYFGLCPFHKEKSPSFSVSPQKQMYYCFGCGAGGNVITFVMEYENMSFVEAVKYLGEKAGVRLPERELSEKEKRDADLRHALFDIHRDAVRFYYHYLTTPMGANGYKYLKNRGLSDETIKKFGLGFAPNTNSGLYEYLKKNGYSDFQIKESALVRFSEKGILDSFWNRVIFPIMDANSKVIAFGGRVMGDGEPKYINSPETKIFEKSRNLYGLYAAKKTRTGYFLICEGYMDVIALHQAGFTNACAALGTAFTQNHAMIIKRYVSDVVLTFDSDGAGIKAALRAIPILRGAGIGIKVLNMKPYKDPDEFIKNLGPEEYQKRIDNAVNAFFFEVECEKNNTDMDNPDQKTKFIHKVAAMLLKFSDPIERNSYMEAVCRNFRIDYNDMKKLVNRLGASIIPEEVYTQDEKKEYKKTVKEDGVLKSERLLLTWITDEPGLYRKISDIIAPDDFSNELYRKAAAIIFKQAEAGSVNPGNIINSFINSDDDYKEVASLFDMKLPQEIKGQDKSRAFTETVVRIKKNSLENQSKNADIIKLQQIIRAMSELQRLRITVE